MSADDENFFNQFEVVDVFDSPKTLRDFYTPPEIIARDKELKQLYIRLRPALDDDHEEQAGHALLEGPNGTGKTAVTKYIAENFVENEDTGDSDAVHVNCGSVDSEYKLAMKIVNTIRSPENRMNPGHDTDEVIYTACKEIEQLGDVVLLVLDEVGNIPEMNDLLYHLTRAEQDGTYIQDTNVSAIFTGNNLQFVDNLTSDIESSLLDKDRIIFDRYDAKELEKILQQRAETAFVDKGIEEGVVSYTASKAAQEGGDARYGLRMLLKAGEHAMEVGESPVTTDHIDVAQERIHRLRANELIEQTHDREQLTLFSFVVQEHRGREEPMMKQVAGEYQRIGDVIGYDHTVQTINRYINSLIDYGLVNEIIDDRPYKRVKITYSPETILSELGERVATKLKSSGIIEENGDSGSVSINPPPIED